MRIYVACLASYNNGVLHGRWIDADSDVDAMGAEVAAILRASPYPNVTRQAWRCVSQEQSTMPLAPECRGCGHQWSTQIGLGGDETPGICPECEKFPTIIETVGEPYATAEEWAIHDFEGLPSSFGEYCGLQAVADYVALCDEVSHIDSDDMAAIVADFGTVDAARNALSDSFCGVYPAFKDYADETADEMLAGHDGLPDIVSRYFDYDAWARDLRHDMNPVDVPSGVAVFHA